MFEIYKVSTMENLRDALNRLEKNKSWEVLAILPAHPNDDGHRDRIVLRSHGPRPRPLDTDDE